MEIDLSPYVLSDTGGNILFFWHGKAKNIRIKIYENVVFILRLFGYWRERVDFWSGRANNILTLEMDSSPFRIERKNFCLK